MDGVLFRAHLDSNGKDLAIEHVQDVEPILEWNRQARRDEQHGDWGRQRTREKRFRSGSCPSADRQDDKHAQRTVVRANAHSSGIGSASRTAFPK